MSNRLQRLEALREKHLDEIEEILEKANGTDGSERDLTADEDSKVKDLAAKADALTVSIDREKNLIDLRNRSKKSTKQATKADPGDETDADSDEDSDGDEDRADEIEVKEFRSKKKSAANRRDVLGTIKAIGKLSHGAGSSLRSRAKQAEKMDPALSLAVTACGIHLAKTLNSNPYDVIDNVLGFGQFANDLYDAKVKALGSTTVGAGAEVMPQEFSSQFIDFLHPQTTILRAGVARIDLSTGNLRIPGGNVGATTSWRNEGADIAYTEVTFREMAMQARNFACITAINNELLQRSPLAVAEIVRSEVATSAALAIDYAGLRGDGTGGMPTGIRNRVAGGNVFSVLSTGTAPTVAQIDRAATSALLRLRNSNVPKLRPTWFMPHRVVLYLASLRGANGEKIYPTMEGQSPMFWGYPVLMSTVIPENGGATTDEAEIILADAGHIWMGDVQGIQMSMSEEASYVQAGNTISAFSRNQTVMRLTGATDFNTRYTNAHAVMTQCRWGA